MRAERARLIHTVQPAVQPETEYLFWEQLFVCEINNLYVILT